MINKGIVIISSLAALFVTSSSGSAQSWCETQKQLNEAERTVCSSPSLRGRDRQINQLYRSSNVSTASQRQWIERRNDCGNDESCLSRVYVDRIYELGGSLGE
jgi:uncharacterized protein